MVAQHKNAPPPDRGTAAYEVAVVGGGIIGSAVAYGLAKEGRRVALLDAASPVDRASRANMGIIYCQCKFLHHPDFVRWHLDSSALFPELVPELEELTGIRICYRPGGGLVPCLGEEEFEQRTAYVNGLQKEAGGHYPGSVVGRNELEKLMPRVRFGPEVTGSAWCSADGLLEPLQLMFALRKGAGLLGAALRFNFRVDTVSVADGLYRLSAGQETVEAERVVLAGGLSNRGLVRLIPGSDLHLPLFPDRGQILLTERIGDVLPYPIAGITRTPGGTIMLGFRRERAGTDPRIRPEGVIHEGRWALRVMPDLAKLRIIRSWSGLRVMPDDWLPLYDTVPGHPRVYVLNVQPAVTLAAIHVKTLPGFVMGGPLPADARRFGLSRFASPSTQERSAI